MAVASLCGICLRDGAYVWDPAGCTEITRRPVSVRHRLNSVSLLPVSSLGHHPGMAGCSKGLQEVELYSCGTIPSSRHSHGSAAQRPSGHRYSQAIYHPSSATAVFVVSTCIIDITWTFARHDILRTYRVTWVNRCFFAVFIPRYGIPLVCSRRVSRQIKSLCHSELTVLPSYYFYIVLLVRECIMRLSFSPENQVVISRTTVTEFGSVP